MSIPVEELSEAAAVADAIVGQGEMATLLRSTDWAATPLGPVRTWPQSLRTAVSICLNSRHPILIWWGPEYVKIYNDAYRPILGQSKHPRALGVPGRAIWPEIWDVIGPMLDAVYQRGEATWSDDQLLVMLRNGYLEEAYFTFSYSPIRDETGGIGGIFTAVSETTQRVLGERRLKTLQDLNIDARSVDEAASAAAQILARNVLDVPFALIYLLDRDGREARLAAATGIAPGSPAAPPTIDLAGAGARGSWPLASVARTGRAELVTDLAATFGDLPVGYWHEPPTSAFVQPIVHPGQPQPAGLLVLGISPRRAFDDDYRAFFGLVAGHVATGLTNARAYHEERQRAETLAELDRAKTEFFSNVSHEFRTPLTLLLGPLRELADGDAGALNVDQEGLVQVAQRNALRLLKLVNTLLDFAHIESGRARATYEPTDLTALTADLASGWRSAIERAGLAFRVDCAPLSQPVYVDRDMWEKIVLNLLSNAFKFTFAGTITVALHEADGGACLHVRDTGTGIPAEELAHIFERFHRVHGARGRSYEGTGIGLALVQQLVRLHGGTVQVESRPGAGSLFSVWLPFGTAHLPAGQVAPEQTATRTALGALPYVEEALRWLPDAQPQNASLQAEAPGSEAAPPRASSHADGPSSYAPHILLADDNADMREYLRRLLGKRYRVEAVPDAESALAVARDRRPDLILADVMMPGVDGFEMLRRLRADPTTRSIPVMLLSARAGEEARLEGLQSGATDYVLKPFNARELLARVDARIARALDIARREGELLRESEARFRAIFQQSPIGIALLDLDGRILQTNQALATMLGYEPGELTGRRPDDLIYPEDVQQGLSMVSEVLAGQDTVFRAELRLLHLSGDPVWVAGSLSLARGDGGQPLFAIGTAVDISPRVQAEAEREAALAALATTADRLRRQSARLNALHDIDLAVLSARSPVEVAQAATRYIREAVPCLRASVILFHSAAGEGEIVASEGAGSEHLGAGTRVPVDTERLLSAEWPDDGHLIEDLASIRSASHILDTLAAAGVRAYIALPLRAGAHLIGALSLGMGRPGPLGEEHAAIARQVADSLSVALHNARLVEQLQASRTQLQELSRRLVEAQEAERRSIARELHDQAGGSLTSLKIALGTLEREPDPGSIVRRASDLKAMVDAIMEDLHRLSVNLRPSSLDRAGLVPALEQLAVDFERRTGVQTDVMASGIDEASDGPLSPTVEITLYRIVQEALTNVARHARAHKVGVILDHSWDGEACRVKALVEDDGIGFEPEEVASRGRLGLFGMQERAEILGGTLAVESSPGNGTTIYVEIPCDHQSPHRR